MLDRTLAPPFNRSTDFNLIHPEKIQLPNGVVLYLINGGQQDVVKVELIFRAGRWYEEVWGASTFTTNLLLKGTSGNNSAAIAQIFDTYGAHVELSPGLDNVSVSLYTLTRYLEPTLALLLEVLTDSVFPEKELEQTRSIQLQNLRVNNEKTSFLASKLFRSELFGEQHPYGKELDEDDLKRISTETLKHHFKNHFGADFILVSGKISASVQQTVSQVLGQLPSRTTDALSKSAPADKPRRIVREKEGSMQSSVRIGKRFIGRNNPRYPEVLLLNHILGGYFGSRLMKNIREEKGYTYGIHASIYTLQNDNYFVIGADVNNENREATFAEVQKELTRLRTEPVAEDELTLARNHFIGSLQSDITTPFAHADKIKNLILYHLPATYYPDLIARMDGVTPTLLMEIANTFFTQDTFYEVAVG